MRGSSVPTVWQQCVGSLDLLRERALNVRALSQTSLDMFKSLLIVAIMFDWRWG